MSQLSPTFSFQLKCKQPKYGIGISQPRGGLGGFERENGNFCPFLTKVVLNDQKKLVWVVFVYQTLTSYKVSNHQEISPHTFLV